MDPVEAMENLYDELFTDERVLRIKKPRDLAYEMVEADRIANCTVKQFDAMRKLIFEREGLSTSKIRWVQ